MSRQTRPEREVSYEQLKEQERLILEATELIAQRMEEQGVSKAELARRIGRSRAYLTQLLTGSRNMTLRTLADLASALEFRVGMHPKPLQGASSESPALVRLEGDGGMESDPISFVRERRRRFHESASVRHGVVITNTDVPPRGRGLRAVV